MNKDFEIINKKANVFTDDKGRVTRDATNNIEDILICENNIEEMEKDLQRSLRKITFAKKKMLSCWDTIFGAIFCLSAGALSSALGIWWLAITLILGSVGYVGFTINDIKLNLNAIRANKCVAEELEDNLKIQKEKLNELNKTKTNDLINQEKKTIYRSEEIHNLKRKLDVIYIYIMHKTRFINEYKKGILRQTVLKNYSFDYAEYYLLEELIKNDLNKNQEKINNKQKTLRRR